MIHRIISLFLIAVAVVMLGQQLRITASVNALNDFSTSFEFRSHILEETFIESLNAKSINKGELVGLYLLEKKLGTEIQILNWNNDAEMEAYLSTCEMIWNDLIYFPIPESTITSNATVSYVDTWGDSRSYGGERLHEGTDIIPAIDKTGYYPVVSITDGVVTNIGWLEQGGYRVGITSPSGAYFYYAHLNSYSAIEEGDEIKAGEILGYMGDTGYGEEGTSGMFVVHLHLGIYINVDGEEISINPYWILRFLDTHKLKYSF